ncbi:MAG: hypothetical protein H6811_03535 [Phycisphaeraceae bacterium]|nr:hypothetical protein [Phycisphaeraceae bacterium]
MPRSVSLDVLDRIEIASPCPMRWEDMAGDDRTRHCDQCDLRVHNIAGLARQEALDLIVAGHGGRLCVRIHRRWDGTILTSDCPVGRRALHRRVATRVSRFGAAALCLLTGGLLFVRVGERSDGALASRQPLQALRNWLKPVVPSPPLRTPPYVITMGSCAPLKSLKEVLSQQEGPSEEGR